MVDDPDVAFGDLLQLGQFHEFVGSMRLRDVARPADDRGVAGLREQRRLGPEIDRVADRQAEFVGDVARGEATGFGRATSPAGSERSAERLLEFRGCDPALLAECREQRIGAHRRQRTKAEAYFRGRRDHVRLDPAFDAADVEAQSGETAETRVRLRLDEIERALPPADRLMHGAVARRVAARRVARAARKRHAHRTDAAMREHRLATRRLGDDDRVEWPLLREKRRDAARVVRFLVGREQEGRIALRMRGRSQQRRRGALDVARAERDRAIVVDPQLERIADQCGEAGTVSRCTLNRNLGLPRTASRLTAPAPWSVSVQSNPGRFARR